MTRRSLDYLVSSARPSFIPAPMKRPGTAAPTSAPTAEIIFIGLRQISRRRFQVLEEDGAVRAAEQPTPMRMGNSNGRSLTAGAMLLASLLAVSPGEVRAAACPAPEPPELSIRHVLPAPKYAFDKTLDEIRALDGKKRHDGTTLGLTRADAFYEMRSRYRVRRLIDGTACASLERADISWGFRDMRVWVAREIARDPCLKDHVLGHENRHVAINSETLRALAPRVKQDLARRLGALKPEAARSAAAAQSALDRRIRAAIDASLESFKSELDRRNAAFDSPAEYARSAKVCSGRIAKILRR